MFDAGAIIFNIKAAGAQVFRQEMAGVDQATRRAGDAAKDAAAKTTDLGDKTDAAGKKARGAKQPLEDQAKATKRVGDENRRAQPEIAKTTGLTEQQTAAARDVSVAMLAAGTAVAAAVTLSVVKFGEFDVGMSNVRAATMATREEQELLADAALDAGADTAYSAREAADAEEELAKAGLSVADIVGGSLNGALSLAAAGQLEVARSATIMATTLKVFRLPAEQAAHVADLLAAAAGKAQGSVDDVSLALDYAGIGLAQFNVPLEESVGTLALFAANGILGEKAGTGLRGALAALTGPSALGAKTMKEYGVNVFDAQGKFIGMAGVAQQLQDAFGKLSEEERAAAMNRIFGNESMNVANVLFEEGAAGVKEWTEAVDDSGFASEQARIKQDNLAGDLEKLGGAFDTALIKTGSGANDVLRTQVQIVTDLVDGYGELDPAAQTSILTIAGGVAAFLLFGGATLGVIGRVGELKKNLEGMNLTMKRSTLIAGAVGIGFTAVLTVVGLLATAQAEARAKAEAYADTLEESSHRITNATRDMVRENLAAKNSFLWIEGDSTFDAAEKLGLGLDLVTDAASGNVDSLQKLRSELDYGEHHTARFQAALEDSGLTLTEFLAAVNQVEQGVRGESASIEEAIRVAQQKAEADRDAAAASDEGAAATERHAEALATLEGGASDAESQISSLADMIRGFGSTTLDAREAERQFQEAIAAVSASIEENGTSLKLNTEAGRANERALDDIAKTALDVAGATLERTGSEEKAKEAVRRGREELIKQLAQFSITGEKAEKYADKLGLIPENIETAVDLNTEFALEELNSFVRNNQGRTIAVNVANERNFADGGIIRQFANGGVVEHYAGGGISEHHVAQIQRAGTYRVWAEPETGGEVYIPLAPSKRLRSEAIMAEAAELLGGTYIPSLAQRFAEGGLPPGASVQAPTGGGGQLRIVSGELTIRDGRAYIEGVVEDVLTDLTVALEGGSNL
jgi:TP901 family phage tail tape measure protein